MPRAVAVDLQGPGLRRGAGVEGDLVEMVAPPKPVNELVPEPIPLDIVYEDEHFLALNKQADLMVHPARGRWSGTLVNGLVHYGQKWSNVNGNWRPGILHRLDRNTTGIMLVAKSDEAHWRIARQFENRTIRKTYMAVAHGVPDAFIALGVRGKKYAVVSALEFGRVQRTSDFDVVLPLERDPQTFDEHENIRLDLLETLRAEAKAAGLWAPQMPPERGGQVIMGHGLKQLADDGLHPNSEGHRKMFERLRNFL